MTTTSALMRARDSSKYRPFSDDEELDDGSGRPTPGGASGARNGQGYQQQQHDQNDGQNGFGEHGHDDLDMKRLGKVQELNRSFSLMSTLGFISVYMATWEIVLISTTIGLINGGLGGFFWEFMITYGANTAIVLSLAELASLSPTSGGQYHWVSEFAPAELQMQLSYLTGWLCTTAWVTSLAAGPYIQTFFIEALFKFHTPDFKFAPWESTLIMAFFTALTILLNVKCTNSMPILLNISLIFHVVGFIVIFLAVLLLSPKNPPSEIFASFTNLGGWPNNFTSFLVGQVGVLWCVLGSDNVVHISEEVQDASTTVPRCMVWSYLLNGAMGVVMALTMLFSIQDLQAAIDAPAPFFAVFQSTGSPVLALLFTLILFFLGFGGSVAGLTASSREIWAFARDKGLPFADWTTIVHRRLRIPLNSVYLVSAASFALCLLNLVSSFAFETVISLNILAFLSTYALAIGCLALKRWRGEPLPTARWSLGKWGLPVNLFAVSFAVAEMVLSCLPVQLPVTLGTANWAPLIYIGALLLALAFYVAHGRRVYVGPVVDVVKLDEATYELAQHEIDEDELDDEEPGEGLHKIGSDEERSSDEGRVEERMVYRV